VDFPYHSTLDIAEYYRRYAETLLAVDESLGRITTLLAERQMLDDTLVIFMGDNGFAFGEHGLIDKRTAYESSMRVPLVMAGAGLPAGTTVSEVVANIDIAPSILDAAGLTPPAMDGRSFLPLARGERVAWREALLYEYYWERNFPQTPTVHAVRGARYKYIRYYGLWDTDELYDLIDDPAETRNLVRDPARSGVVKAMNGELFDLLAATGGMYIPLAPDRGPVQNLRRRSGSAAADFPGEQFPQ
jgi:N-acetylglucosamine-6-sulfatase